MSPVADVEVGTAWSEGQMMVDFIHTRHVTLPGTTYSLVAVFPALFTLDDKVTWIRVLLLAIVQYYLTLAASCTYIYHIDTLMEAEIDLIESDACTALSGSLLVVSLGMFTTSVLTDMEESICMVNYFLHAPTAKGLLSAMLFRKKEGKLEFASGGLSMLHKAVIMIFVLLPKLLVAVLLLLYGHGYLYNSTSDTNLFLHTLSLTFVLKLDNILYAYFTSAEHQQMIKDLPKVDLPMTRLDLLITKYSTFVKFIMVGIFLVVFMKAELGPVVKCKA